MRDIFRHVSTANGMVHRLSNNDTEDRIFAIPLNTTFDARSLLAANAYSYIDIQGLQEIYEGAFFKDATGDMLYYFAGYNGTAQEPTNQLTTFNVTSSTLATVDVSGGDFNYGLREGGLWTTTEDTTLGLSFFAGGIAPTPPGMVMFDSNTLSWTNTTIDASLSESQYGHMVFTRFGANGTLIVIGGYDKNRNTTDGLFYSLRSMTNIAVYDIASSTWFNVTATGQVPAGRANFCAAVSAAPDYSRYVSESHMLMTELTIYHSVNIMIYGGYTEDLYRGWEQV